MTFQEELERDTRIAEGVRTALALHRQITNGTPLDQIDLEDERSEDGIEEVDEAVAFVTWLFDPQRTAEELKRGLGHVEELRDFVGLVLEAVRPSR